MKNLLALVVLGSLIVSLACLCSATIYYSVNFVVVDYEVVEVPSDPSLLMTAAVQFFMCIVLLIYVERMTETPEDRRVAEMIDRSLRREVTL